ncbi:OprD family outer membrane porin [Simiduia curdlanivorans]|uniref:OprD family outer membrane porin n=1 Tax=Simiduia curdlanivorans TaxID=1492769 RepID=A0ABV8V8K4_9GAMM|nr:OprD family outer membrane porin [Simiduia curdlanivorans]MDN3639426.1 OprD family outer membrane porin [Simiduia curdlanivorans]
MLRLIKNRSSTLLPPLCLLCTAALSTLATLADDLQGVDALLEPGRAPHQLNLKLRNLYFNKRRDSSSKDSSLINQWGQAAEINYANKQLASFLEVGASAYAALKLYGPDDNRSSDIFEQQADGSLADGYAKIGQLYGKLKFNEHNYLSLGAQVLDYNLLESSASRATPSTFLHRAVHLGKGGWSGHYLYTDRWSPRYANNYEKFTNNAGDTISNIQIAGISYANDQLYFIGEVGRADAYLERQSINTGYRFKVNSKTKLNVNLRYHAAQDAGALYDSTFGGRRAGTGLDGRKVSLLAEYEGEKFHIGTMLARNGKDGFDGYWYSKDHGTLRDWSQRQVSEFVAADERIFHIQTRYDMNDTLPGFQWALTYTRGTGARASKDYESNPDNDAVEGSEWEVNLVLEYDFVHQGVKGLTFRYIGAYYQNTIDTVDIWNNSIARSNDDDSDNRFYLDYTIAF